MICPQAGFFSVPWLAPGFVLFASLALAQPQTAPTTQATEETPAAAQETLILNPPRTHEEIAARIALAASRLDALAPTTQPMGDWAAGDPERELLDARRALYESWSLYHARLREAAELLQQVDLLKGEQRVQQLNDRIATTQQRASAVAEAPLPASREEFLQARADLESAEAQLAALSDLQSTRASQLATGFRQQRDTLEADRRRLLQERDELQTSLEATPTTAPTQRAQRDLRQRQLTVRAALGELNLQILQLKTEQTSLLQKQDARIAEADGQLVAALQRRVTAASAAWARSKLEQLEARLQEDLPAHEQALLQLQHFAENVQVHYFRSEALRNELRSVFPKRDLGRLRARLTASAATWSDYADLAPPRAGRPPATPDAPPADTPAAGTTADPPPTQLGALAYRSGKEVLELRSDALAEHRQFQAEREDLERKLRSAVERLHELQMARDRALARFGELSDTSLSTTRTAGAAELTRVETQVTAFRNKLGEVIDGTVSDARALVSRLNTAVGLLDHHVAMLDSATHALYRTALRRRESGLVGIDFRAVRAEWLHVFGRGPHATLQPEVGAASLSAAGLTKAPRDPRAELRARLGEIRDDLYAARSSWWIAAILLVVGLSAGLWVHRIAVRRARLPLERLIAPTAVDPETGQAVRQFRDRMDLLLWQGARDSVVPVAVGVALVGAGWLADLPERALLPIATVVGALVGVYVLLRVVRHLFDPDDRCRVTPCDDRVARHYRYWARALLLFTVVLVPLLALLTLFDLAPATRSLLWEAWKVGVLLILLGFLTRRQRVMQFREQGQSARRIILVNAVYPVVLAAVLLLLALEVVGYGVLVEYVSSGVLASIAAVLVIVAFVEYVCDLLDAYARRESPLPFHRKKSRQLEDALPRPTSYLVRVLKSVLRLAAAGTIVVLVARIWNLYGYFALIPWQKTVVAVVTVIIALLVDRVVTTTLNALQAAGRMPASTGGMFRRWLRGLLGVLVLLALVVLAGAPVEKLWAPLSALFAMVAIGFVAVWSMLSNILATVIILLWRPFNVGEEIEVQPDGVKGRVVDINFMYTMLKSDGDVRTNVPNAMFIQKYIRRQRVSAQPARSLAEQLVAEKPAGE